MWPQKWKASASPGRTAAARALPPAAAKSKRPTRPRKPRLDVSCASESLRRSLASGTCPLEDPLLCRGEHALELAEAVERALRPHDAVPVERDGEGAPGDAQRAPRVRVLLLVEDPQRDNRVATERRHGRREAAAEVAGGRREDGERELFPAGESEAVDERCVLAERRPFVGKLERSLRRQLKPENAYLARERQDGDGQAGDGGEQAAEPDGQPGVGAQRDLRQRRKREERSGENEVPRDCSPADGRAGPEAAARLPRGAAASRDGERRGEGGQQDGCDVRGRGRAERDSGRKHELARGRGPPGGPAEHARPDPEVDERRSRR